MLRSSKLIAVKDNCLNERGQSLTELALVMVFLLIMLTGVYDVGRALFAYIAIRDAAQEGALVGSYDPGNDCTVVNDRVRSSSSSKLWVDLSDDVLSEPDDYVVYVDCRRPTPYCAGEEMGVAVTISGFPLTMPFIGTFVGSQTIEISASITDTIITNNPSATCP